MFSSIVPYFALIALSLSAILCEECKEHEKPCSSLEELGEEQNSFTTWANAKCPDNTTVLPQSDIDTYKGCIKTHLTPCLQAEEDKVFKQIFVELMDKFDLCHVCNTETQKGIENSLIDIYMDHKDEMDKRAVSKCSVIKQAMHEVIKCAGIKQ